MNVYLEKPYHPDNLLLARVSYRHQKVNVKVVMTPYPLIILMSTLHFLRIVLDKVRIQFDHFLDKYSITLM